MAWLDIDRLICCVPDCKRSMTPESAMRRWGDIPGEWICQMHWSRLTQVERRVWTRIRRKAKRYGWDAIDPERSRRLWAALRRRASDRPPSLP